MALLMGQDGDRLPLKPTQPGVRFDVLLELALKSTLHVGSTAPPNWRVRSSTFRSYPAKPQCRPVMGAPVEFRSFHTMAIVSVAAPATPSSCSPKPVSNE